MMLALELIERIARRLQEILVRREDGSVGGEFNDGLHARNGVDLSGVLGGEQFCPRDLGNNLDDLEYFPGRADDRIV